MTGHRNSGKQVSEFYARLVLVAAAPPAAYFVVGDVSEPGTMEELDYVWKPPQWTDSTIRNVGMLSILAIAIAVAVLIRERRSRSLRANDVKVIALLIGVGVLAALSFRMVTAGVHGANFGVGFVAFFVGPTMLSLLATARSVEVRSRISPNHPSVDPDGAVSPEDPNRE
jgi:hypothetical protein